MNNSKRIFMMIFFPLITLALYMWLIDIVNYAEAGFNLGVWNLVHGNIRIFSIRTFSAKDAFVLLILFVALICINNITKAIRNKKPVYVVIGVVVLLICLPGIIRVILLYVKQSDIAKMRNTLMDERTVVHAGGFVNDESGTRYDYTNSYEALNNAYNFGNKIIEIDFFILDSGDIVCAHPDSEDTDKYKGQLSSSMSLDQFLDMKVYGKFTTMSFDNLASFMRDHKDLYIVTDVKGECEKFCNMIAERYPDLKDRLLIQIYHPSEYEPIVNMGFKYIIYTMYEAHEMEVIPESVKQACIESDIMALTYWEGWMRDDQYSGVLQEDIPKCEHTVNDTEVMKQDLLNGINCFYTDNVDNQWLRD